MSSDSNRAVGRHFEARGMLSRRHVLALGAATCVLPGVAQAQEYPTRPIRLMVGFASGGGVDLSARLLAPRLGEEMKGTIVVENKAGASGMICSEYVSRSAPDGYTLMYTGGSAVAIAPQLVAKPSINSLTDLAPINLIGASPLVLSLHPGAKIRDLQEFLAQAHTRELKIASAGVGTLTHLTIELLSQATGGKIIHVPYKGGGAALADSLAGHVDGMVSDIPPVFQHFQDRKLLPIALTSEKRFELLPNVPTVGESLKGFSAESWFGVFAPKGTSATIVEKVSAALVKIVAREEIAAQLRKAGVNPFTHSSPEVFQRFVANEYNRWGKLVKEKNITMP
jgi:tripartite-type tricarboxylate transporter receptor subunit TctC